MSNEGIKLPQKKKNDLLKKFLNAQQYTKTLKKNAIQMTEDNSYAAYSYDEIQTYPEIPQSAKLSSTKMFSKQLLHSIDTININDSHDFTSIPKTKKSHGYSNMTQSSNEIPYMKSKKSSYSKVERSSYSQIERSSYSQIEKSQPGNKSIKGDIDIPTKTKTKDYDVQSMTKEKYTSEAMHESLGAMKTDSFFKPKYKKSFNISNLHQYESQKLSAEDDNSFSKNRRHNKLQQKQNENKNKKQSQEQCPYNLSPSNFMKLINKVQELQDVILMYQQAIGEMKKKTLDLSQQNNQIKMSQIYIDSLKQELLQEKNKNASLRQKIYMQQSYLKEYEHSLIESVQKIGKFYEQQISKITILEKQNKFLKFMLRLQLQNQNLQKLKSQVQQSSGLTKEDKDQTFVSKLSITKNMGQFKEKFTQIVDKSKKKLTS